MNATQGFDPYLQVVVNGDLSAPYEPFEENAFQVALGQCERDYQAPFTSYVRDHWPALEIVQCMLAAKQRAAFSFRDIRFQARDASLVIVADIDGPALAALPPETRAAQVFRIAMTLLARALEKRKVDAAPVLAWRDAHLPAAGDVSMPVETKPAKRERAPKSLTASLVESLLPVVHLHGHTDGAHRFHVAWVGEDDELPGVDCLADASGTVGEYVEPVSRVLATDEPWAPAIVERLAASWQSGLRPVKDDECVDLQVDHAIAGMGTDADLTLRHAIEDLLGEQLLLRGIGFVDGGEIGSGEMSVFATVLEGTVTPDDVRAWLKQAGHPAPLRITIDD